MIFLPFVNQKQDDIASIAPTPAFEIIVETIVSEEAVQIETEPTIESEPIQEAVSNEPEPVIEVAISESPEPVPTEEPVIEETQVEEEVASVDKESTDNEQDGYPIIVKVSHYNPSLGGPNCASFVNGECMSKMSNGERWQEYWGEYNTIACPFELPFGTIISLDGNEFTCRDRGGAIIITWEGYYWIDILAEKVPYSYGELREAYILK